MILRFILWIGSLFFDMKVKCALCPKKVKYKNTAVIKVRHGNNAITDMLICNECADNLEKLKKRE